MLNSIVIMGRLTDEPDFRMTPSQVPVASFTVACERDFTGREKTKQTDFINVVAWRGNAEFVSKHFHKGSMIVVDGRLQTRTWEDRDGKKHEEVEINAESVYFGESREPKKEGQ